MRLDLKASEVFERLTERIPMSSDMRASGERLIEDLLGEVVLEEQLRIRDLIHKHISNLQMRQERVPQHAASINNAINHLNEVLEEIERQEERNGVSNPAYPDPDPGDSSPEGYRVVLPSRPWAAR